MKTALIAGKAVANIDKQIIGNLLLDQASVEDVRQEQMVIGIRNEAGEIYRLIGAAKLNNYMNAMEELMDLEMVDELEDEEESREGCDAIFSEG
ncbi:hypothetical protein [Undibacterium terreum]|uniref:Uncharacterized protein n=1 Tax=Undibacterium terreum TaxID=1224302 RepID=A0A916U7L6_9BURK|nr:hypothetical protein [Undibacterium terreum]GGC62106.1 hypothetical protein GCM10011396_06240 [Undibacterium terreum]